MRSLEVVIQQNEKNVDVIYDFKGFVGDQCKTQESILNNSLMKMYGVKLNTEKIEEKSPAQIAAETETDSTEQEREGIGISEGK